MGQQQTHRVTQHSNGHPQRYLLTNLKAPEKLNLA